MKRRAPPTRLAGVLAGSDEPVFRVLPQRILEDLRRTNSESTLLWNLIYPIAQPSISLRALLSLRPLWGSRLELADDSLVPFYWGFDVLGQRLTCLNEVLALVDGEGPQTAVDLFLVGTHQLILVEAKRAGSMGRCHRYLAGRCPEIHGNGDQGCRYWEIEAARFSVSLDFGHKPIPAALSPICNRHYQLARTLIVGEKLAERLRRQLHLWLFVPRSRWPELERNWVSFSDRVKDDGMWGRLRVLAWEEIRDLDS